MNPLTFVAPLLAAALLAAGCGDSDTPTTASAPATIRHALGTTTVPTAPKRIVTVGYSDHETVLALGLKPVGAMDWFADDTFAKWPWERAAWGDDPPQSVSSKSYEIDFEKVAELRPDLILGIYADLKKTDYDKLSRIAPTVAQAKGTRPYLASWRVMTRLVAKAVGRAERGEELIRKTDAQFADFRKAHPEFAQQTAAIADAGEAPKSVYAFAEDDPRGQFLRDMGFKVPPRLAKRFDDGFGLEVSHERLDLLDVDRLFLLIDPPARRRLDRDALFNRLAVAREGRVTNLPYYSSTQLGAALAFNTVLSIPHALKSLDQQFGSTSKRVVTLDFPSTDTVLGLGVTPIAIGKVGYVRGGIQSWTKSALAGRSPQLLDSETSIPLEKLAALKPDLIVATNTYNLQPVLSKVKAIAPVVTWTKGPGVDTWQESTRLVGRALGREEQARKLVTDTEGLVRRARSEHPALAGKTVTLFNYWKGNAYAISDPQDFSVRFLSDLGMKLAPAVRQRKGKDGRLQVGDEQLPLLDADVVLGTTSGTPRDLDALVRGKLFRQLSAVKRGAYASVPIGPATSIAFPSALSVRYAVDQLVPVLDRLAT
jgi:iron complex transport system substrate-binding protein